LLVNIVLLITLASLRVSIDNVLAIYFRVKIIVT